MKLAYEEEQEGIIGSGGWIASGRREGGGGREGQGEREGEGGGKKGERREGGRTEWVKVSIHMFHSTTHLSSLIEQQKSSELLSNPDIHQTEKCPS